MRQGGNRLRDLNNDVCQKMTLFASPPGSVILIEAVGARGATFFVSTVRLAVAGAIVESIR
jgi:hypothetical protein